MSSTRVEFYFNVDHRLHYACRLVRRSRHNGQTVLAHCADGARLGRLDQALWTFSPLDFLPHVSVDSPLADRTPTLLTSAGNAAPAMDVLLMLDDVLPEGFEHWVHRYQRVIEVVSVDEDDRRTARERFKAYRQFGLPPASVDGADQ